MVRIAVSLARVLPAVLVSAVVIAVVLAGSWELADSAGLPARFSLLVAAIATAAVCTVGMSRLARFREGPEPETDALELGVLSGAALGVVLGLAVVVFGLR